MTRLILAIGVFASVAGQAYVPKHLRLKGHFTQTNISGPECNGIFTAEEFQVTHTRAGTAGLTSVLNFKGQVDSFLNGMTLVGLLDYNQNFLDEKNFKKGLRTYRLIADGLVDARFLTAVVKATIVDTASAKTICTATAEIYAD